LSAEGEKSRKAKGRIKKYRNRFHFLILPFLALRCLARVSSQTSTLATFDPARYQCYHFPAMAQLLVRGLEKEVVDALRQKAREESISMEEAHRRVLRSLLLNKKSSFKEALSQMPDDGDDAIFERVRRQRRRIA
jgi:antitoxin FitA